MQSKIQNLLKDKKSVIIFGVDGVLARMEFGEHTHSINDEETWDKLIESGIELYQDVRPFKTMQNFLKGKNMDNIYVITKVTNNKEFLQKLSFLKSNYNIKEDNCYMVFKDKDKLLLIDEIKEKYPDLDDKYIIFVEDSIDTLNYVMLNSEYSTMHISSFLE